MSKTRIKWSADERAAIAAELVNVYVDNPYTNGYDAIMRAQRVLPKERQRSSMSKTMPTLYISEIAEAKLAASERRKVIKALHAVPTPVVDPTLGDVFERMIDMIVRRVVAELRKPVPAEPPVAAPPAPTRTNTKEREQLLAPAVKPDPINLLIIGLNGRQPDMIEDLEDKLGMDFRFLTSEEAATRPFLHRTHTVLMTRFISHAAQDKYRCASKLHYCNGSVSELRNLLIKIAEEARK